MGLHPKRNSGLQFVAPVATAFPMWQVSVVVSFDFLRHFFKDMEIARNADAATDYHELSREIVLLCKGTGIGSTKVYRLIVSDLEKGVDTLLPLSISIGRPKGRGRRRPRRKQR